MQLFLSQQMTDTKNEVRFDFSKTIVNKIPSLSDFSPWELSRLYYQKSDYEYFRRTYERQAVMLGWDRVKGSPRMV
jgi:hypothetical protein